MADLTSFMLTDTIVWNTGFWGTLIGWFNGFILNYGWTIIVFTVIIKLVLSPLDFLQRKAGANNAIVQAKLQPELDKIKQKYANNPEKMKQKLNEKQMEFMRSGQMKMGSTCTIMLVYMGITLLVFLTLFYAMQGIANIQTVNSYIEFENKYDQVYADTASEEQAQNAVLELYNSGTVTESWLWIDNIWKSDTRTSVVSSYEEFKGISQSVNESPYSFNEEDANFLSEARYNTVMSKITSTTEGKWNGYYILIVLSGVVSFLTFQITATSTKKRSGGAQQASPQAPNVTGIMKFVLPGVMVLITLFYSSAFALYILANSTFTLLAIPLYNSILTKSMKNKKGANGTGSQQDNINVDYKINKITKVED